MTESKINKTFSAADVKHGLSLFSKAEIRAVEKLITQQDDKFLISVRRRIGLRLLSLRRLLGSFGFIV